MLIQPRLDMSNNYYTFGGKSKISEMVFSEGMQVGDQVGDLLFIQLVAELWHHVATANHGLLHVLIRRGQATRQVRLLVQVFQPGAFVAMRRVSRMANCAMDVVQPPPVSLLRVQAKFGIGHFLPVSLAAGQPTRQQESNQDEQDGRCSAQMTIMS